VWTSRTCERHWTLQHIFHCLQCSVNIACLIVFFMLCFQHIPHWKCFSQVTILYSVSKVLGQTSGVSFTTSKQRKKFLSMYTHLHTFSFWGTAPMFNQTQSFSVVLGSCDRASWAKCEDRENQQDATIRCLLSTSVSTCFGHHYAHFQENKDLCYCMRCAAMVLLDVVGSCCGALRCRVRALWRLLFEQ